MATQVMRNHSRAFSSMEEASGRLSPAFSPEGQLLVWCGRTDLSIRIRHLVREAAGRPMDWQLLVSLAWCHGVGPLVYRALSTVCADLVPKESMNVLRQRTQAGSLLNRVLAHELVQVCQAFSENGVPAIAFKGAPLAVMAYQDLNLRDFDDLDFIVPQARLDDAKKVLYSIGFRPWSRSRDEVNGSPSDEPYHVFVKKNSPTPVDLQWVMAHEQFAFRLDRADIWGRCLSISINGSLVNTLAPEELLIVLCVHGSKHAWERLKWVTDVAELVRSQQLNWKRVLSTATKWKCRRMLLLGLELANQLMETPLPADVLNEISADHDVTMLARRMPKSTLTHQHDGIDEHDGPALYFSLKDSWWERWRYGLVLVRHGHPLIKHLPSWFRWKRQMTLFSRTGEFFRASPANNAVKAIRRAIGRSNSTTH
jgi:Uncharacterised nucleotidyltransferase